MCGLTVGFLGSWTREEKTPPARFWSDKVETGARRVAALRGEDLDKAREVFAWSELAVSSFFSFTESEGFVATNEGL